MIESFAEDATTALFELTARSVMSPYIYADKFIKEKYQVNRKKKEIPCPNMKNINVASKTHFMSPATS